MDLIDHHNHNSNGPLYGSSWDIKKAFDSPSKNLLKFAWSRLGVDTEFAEHLVSLGENSPTVVRTNFAMDIMENSGP